MVSFNGLQLFTFLLAAPAVLAQSTTTTMDSAAQCTSGPVSGNVFNSGGNTLCCLGVYTYKNNNGQVSNICNGVVVTISGSGVQTSTVAAAISAAETNTAVSTVTFNAAPTGVAAKGMALGMAGAAVVAAIL